MIGNEISRLYPSVKSLIRDNVASRINQKDATLYDFNRDAKKCASEFMGWATLASQPPHDIQDIITFSLEAKSEGLDQVLLLGEGGSTQGPMTITKYNSVDSNVNFKVLDSVSPVRVRSTLETLNSDRLLVIVSSKSGGTIEPMSNLIAVKRHLKKNLVSGNVEDHLIAITDPGTKLEQMAKKEKWRAIFNGEPDVGGRYSVMSVFGLVPAALVGIDLEKFVQQAAKAEEACSQDNIDNPAIRLAAFLYDNLCRGRDKVCFLSPKRGRVLGLWIEQLVAESLGKNGQGILPNIDPDSLDLTNDASQDRTACIYLTKTDTWDERKNFEMSLSAIHEQIPEITFKINSVYELANDFIIWEYAVAMCGYLMKECPFDQPDVASAKAATLDVLNNGTGDPDAVTQYLNGIWVGDIELRASKALDPYYDTAAHVDNSDNPVENTLRALMKSIEPADYIAINAFIPFTGEGRREGLEQIRHAFASTFDAVSCLEIGPRYLHSTGQLQKGGKNSGVFLIISTDELKDIPLGKHSQAPTMATLAKAQAIGDYKVLDEKGRRVVHIHLPDNTGTTIRRLAQVISSITREFK